MGSLSPFFFDRVNHGSLIGAVAGGWVLVTKTGALKLIRGGSNGVMENGLVSPVGTERTKGGPPQGGPRVAPLKQPCLGSRQELTRRGHRFCA